MYLMKKRFFLIWIACCWQTVFLSAVELCNLKVEYASCPIGIDAPEPRFSWQITANPDERGIKQTAYHLWVCDERGKCVWDSGSVTDDSSLNIRYGGEPLTPETRYEWKLCVWVQDKLLTASSCFETGLMSADDTGERWDGAEWIGGGEEDIPLYSHYLPVFKLNYVFRFDAVAPSLRTAFVYGANDRRLMDANKNLFKLANGKDESFIRIEIDANPLDEEKEAVLRVYRAGYCPTDNPAVPLKEFPIPKERFNRETKHREHTLTLTSDLGFTRFFFDGETEPFGEINLNPLGQGGDFIAFPVVGDVGFGLPEGKYSAALRLEIGNFRSPGNVLATVKPSASAPESQLHLVNPGRNAAPMLRTVFSPRKEVVKARLYVTARGIYDFYINGQRVGDDYFNPGATQYNRTHLYQTFDVTPLIRAGENVAGAILSEGWWSGGCTYTGGNWNYFGDRQSLLAKLVLTYADGEKESLVTRPDTWKFFNQGPVVYGSFFQGEVYDAQREKLVDGWHTCSYDDSAWMPAQVVPLEGTVSTVGGNGSPRVDDYSGYRLTGQSGQTVKAVRELVAQSVEQVRPGVFVYDMGQNMVGVPHITLTGCEPGQHIYLRFAEVKYPHLSRYSGNEGMIMLENIRAAMAQDIYIACGNEQEIIAPRFTYHGYRFVEITGIDHPLPLECVKGTVLSSVDKLLSHYETSNPKVNRLWENIVWSTYGNFLSIPTDCPQRNERMGWAGDISVFSRTATYLIDASQFLRRYLRAMRDLQREDGRFPDIAPLGGGFGGMLWGSAGITIPWECYIQYRDEELLREHYPSMKHYIRYILDKCISKDTGVLEQEKVWGNLGDWLGLEDSRNDATLLWEAYFIYDLKIMQQIASVLGHDKDRTYYERLCEERVDFFNRTYIATSTGKTRSADGQRIVDTQTSYVLPLAFDIIPDTLRRKVADCLINSIMRENKTDDGIQCPPYSLMTGFIGTAWVSRALSDCGRADVAYRLLQQTSYPSWIYPVEQGATTIWERLNSYTHTDGFGSNNRMNSFNHYSFGAVGSWMYNYSLGIQPDIRFPGFKHFILRPEPDPTGQMKQAKGFYDSMYGRIESKWEIMPHLIEYTFSVPANTDATVYLPVKELRSVEMNGSILRKDADFVMESDRIKMELASGTYTIKVFHE